MSEFKFACPVCGQHITCDSGSTGTQMNCPTCFRDLVVPQPPAAGSPNMVLTASEVHKRTIHLPGNGVTTSSGSPSTSKKFPVAAIALVALVICAAGGGIAFRDKIFHSGQPKPDVETNALPVVEKQITPLATPASAGSGTNWTLNLAKAQIPDAPSIGRVNGSSFSLQRATIQGGNLDLRQGSKWPPDLGVSVRLFAKQAEDLAGKTVVIESTRTNAPKVIIRWKNDQGKPVNKEYTTGFAMQIEFGQVSGKHLPGKIYIAAPDDLKSYIAGTFSAEIRKPPAPKKAPGS